MHELGIIIEIVKTVENFAKTNGLTKIDTLVLQVGEISTVIPKYIEECYPAAVDGTSMQETKLKIEILSANAMCNPCGKPFPLVNNNGICPLCKGKDIEILSGREFLIKEIIAC